MDKYNFLMNNLFTIILQSDSGSGKKLTGSVDENYCALSDCIIGFTRARFTLNDKVTVPGTYRKYLILNSLDCS
jgi:hypothetical protein